jgi:hypothetical protein
MCSRFHQDTSLKPPAQAGSQQSPGPRCIQLTDSGELRDNIPFLQIAADQVPNSGLRISQLQQLPLLNMKNTHTPFFHDPADMRREVQGERLSFRLGVFSHESLLDQIAGLPGQFFESGTIGQKLIDQRLFVQFLQ